MASISIFFLAGNAEWCGRVVVRACTWRSVDLGTFLLSSHVETLKLVFTLLCLALRRSKIMWRNQESAHEITCSKRSNHIAGGIMIHQIS